MKSNQITILKNYEKFIGFAFGSNSSISDIPLVVEAFDIETKYIGMDRYQATQAAKTPTHIATQKFVVKDTVWYGLYFNASEIKNTGSLKQHFPQPQTFSENEMLATWGPDFFAITVHYKNKALLDTLLNAIIKADFAIVFEETKTFSQKGLKLIIPSLIPQSVKIEMAEEHKNQHKQMLMSKNKKSFIGKLFAFMVN